jgi:hypothetical protein
MTDEKGQRADERDQISKPVLPITATDLDWLAVRRVKVRGKNSHKSTGEFVSEMRDEENR